MATFLEINTQLMVLRQRREIFVHMLEYVDGPTFRSHDGKIPEKVLVTTDQTRVPESAFESVASEITNVLNSLDQQIVGIENLQVNHTAPTPVAPASQESTDGPTTPVVTAAQPVIGGRGGRRRAAQPR